MSDTQSLIDALPLNNINHVSFDDSNCNINENINNNVNRTDSVPSPFSINNNYNDVSNTLMTYKLNGPNPTEQRITESKIPKISKQEEITNEPFKPTIDSADDDDEIRKGKHLAQFNIESTACFGGHILNEKRSWTIYNKFKRSDTGKIFEITTNNY